MSALSQALETVTIPCWIDVQRQPGSTEGPGPSIATDSSPTGPLSSFEPASGQVLWWTAVRHSLVRTVGCTPLWLGDEEPDSPLLNPRKAITVGIARIWKRSCGSKRLELGACTQLKKCGRDPFLNETYQILVPRACTSYTAHRLQTV